MVAARHWASIGETTFAAGIWLLWGASRLLGRGAMRWLLWPVVLVYWMFAREARDASLQYLQRLQAATGALGHEPGARDTLRHFNSFAATILDKLLAVSGRYDFARVRLQGELPHGVEGRGGVLVTAHVGCVELSQALGERDRRFSLKVLVHTRHAERFNAILRRLQPNRRIDFMQVTEVDAATALELLMHVDQGGWVAVVGDRTPVRSSKTVRLPFLGQQAHFPVGAYVLAALLRGPLWFVTCVRDGPTHRVEFARLADRVDLPRAHRAKRLREFASLYVHRLEAVLRTAPYEWFNFFDFWHQDATGEIAAGQIGAGPDHERSR